MSPSPTSRRSCPSAGRGKQRPDEEWLPSPESTPALVLGGSPTWAPLVGIVCVPTAIGLTVVEWRSLRQDLVAEAAVVTTGD